MSRIFSIVTRCESFESIRRMWSKVLRPQRRLDRARNLRRNGQSLHRQHHDSAFDDVQGLTNADGRAWFPT